MIVAIYPPECSESVRDGLALSSAGMVDVDDLAPDDQSISEADVLVVELGDQPMRRLRELSRVEEALGIPTLVVVERDQTALLEDATGVADFISAPIDPVDLRVRLRRLRKDPEQGEIVTFKDLEVNPLTYQATLAGEPMDLTFMEYELLRYLVDNPIRVWSREQLLSKVWGYDYYGGARTVDVHVRRLRSKLGEERSSWITTVRSVGYRFG